MTVEEIMQQVRVLSLEEKKRLISEIVDTIAEPAAGHSIMELEGLGEHIWENVDVEDYINQLRDEWDEA